MSATHRAASRFALTALLFLATGCFAGPPKNLDLSLEKPSAHAHYHVQLIQPEKTPRINELHSWNVRLTTIDGAPVSGAHFVVDGGMPQHGHGLPTRPRVTEEPGSGVYLIEGMKFSMTGWWEIKLAIQAPEGNDQVTFNTVVQKPAKARTARNVRDRWSEDELQILASMQLSSAGARPADPSNAYEHNAGAAKFGRILFEDQRFSRNGEVACSTCHLSTRNFQDDSTVGHGVGTGRRRTMPVMGASYSPFLFWDGRKDSLWSQALGPIEDAAEHGFNRSQLAALVRADHADAYEEVFGPLPQLPAVLPVASPQGDDAERAAWARLPAATREDINRIFANAGKAIAAYEAQISYGESAFDRYVAASLAGDANGQTALTAQQARGLKLFIGKGQCGTCHNGPLFTDHAFHNTGVPAHAGTAPDQGRAEGVQRLLADEFNCLGRYSDARPEQCGELNFVSVDDPQLMGAFRTPSLRNVALRAPYMHAGQIATLEGVVAHYASSPRATVGESELALAGKAGSTRQPIRLSPAEIRDVAAFLRALSGPVVHL